MLKVEIQVYFGFSPKLINAWGIENYALRTSPVVSVCSASSSVLHKILGKWPLYEVISSSVASAFVSQ